MIRMKKKFGYLLAVIGLIGLALNSTIGRKYFPILEKVSKEYLLIPALVLIVLGVIILIIIGRSGNAKQVKKEVPIYKGKKIIGYRVED